MCQQVFAELSCNSSFPILIQHSERPQKPNSFPAIFKAANSNKFFLSLGNEEIRNMLFHFISGQPGSKQQGFDCRNIRLCCGSYGNHSFQY